MESALKLGDTDLAAGQRHSFENALIPECRFLIGLFRRAAALACIRLVDFVVFLCHRECTCDGESLACLNYCADSLVAILQQIGRGIGLPSGHFVARAARPDASGLYLLDIHGIHRL